MKCLLLGLGCLALVAVASADVITLKDGSKLEGDIRHSGEGYVVKEISGAVTTVPMEKVASIDVRPQSGSDAAMGRLQSLRRAVENVPDIKQILDRYRTFIDQNPNTPAGAAAEKEIRLWQDRLDQGLVKVGDRWMTQTARDALRDKSSDVAIQIHDLCKQGHIREASGILDRAIQVDPQNVSFIYLRGVIQYQQEIVPPARKSFETVIATAPDHAPSLNNLAVILWRQNAHIAALGYYDRAMLAAPGSREILDNIAEALNALPKEQRESAVVKKLLRHFKEQDDAMQKKMAAVGEYRWGATWVSEKELKKLQDAQKAAKDQLTQMEQDFDAVKKRVALLEKQIADMTNEINLLDSQTYAQGANGQIVRLPYPPLYYTLLQQLGALKAERETRVADLDRLRKSAKQVQQQIPAPKFTELQKIIDADGMPMPAGAQLPPPPAVQPPVGPAQPPIGPAQPPATQPGGNVRVPL